MKVLAIRKRLSILCSVLFSPLSTISVFADGLVKIDLLAKRRLEKAMKKCFLTAEFLSVKIDKKVRIQLLKFREITNFIKGTKIDFLLVNFSIFAGKKNQFGGEVIASRNNSRRRNAFNQCGVPSFFGKNYKNIRANLQNNGLSPFNFLPSTIQIVRENMNLII